MRTLLVFSFSFFALLGCSSGGNTPTTDFSTNRQYDPGTYYQQGYNNYSDPNYYDSSGSYYDQGGYGYDDLPSGVFPAVFGWDGRDYTIFLGLLVDRNNSYSACNPMTYGNPAMQNSLRNSFTFANPYADYSAYNPSAQRPPTLWNYDTNSGQASFIGYVRKNAQYDPDRICY